MNDVLMKAALATMAGVASAAAAGTTPQPPRANVEFRRAEAKPTAGLKAAEIAGTSRTIYLHPSAELTESDIASATVIEGSAIDVALTAVGARKLEKLSSEHGDRPLAILVNGKVIAAPTIRARLGGTVIISGKFTPDEARTLAAALGGN